MPLRKIELMTPDEIINAAKIELTRSMKLAAARDEYESAGDFKRIIKLLQMAVASRTFTETEISQLQSRVHAITGDGPVMMLFNELLGVCAG